MKCDCTTDALKPRWTCVCTCTNEPPNQTRAYVCSRRHPDGLFNASAQLCVRPSHSSHCVDTQWPCVCVLACLCAMLVFFVLTLSLRPPHCSSPCSYVRTLGIHPDTGLPYATPRTAGSIVYTRGIVYIFGGLQFPSSIAAGDLVAIDVDTYEPTVVS